MEYQELLARKKAAYSEYHQAKDAMKIFALARRNVESFLEISSKHPEPGKEKRTVKTY